MSTTVLYMSMSLDGFIAGPNETPDNGLGDGGQRLHDWLIAESGPEAGRGHEHVRQAIRESVSGVNRQVVDEFMATGAVVAGRGTVEPAGYWDGDHHDGVPIFIVSRNEPPAEVREMPLVTFVGDVATAMAEAKRAAGDKGVLVHGAGITQLALAARVLDELEISVVPVLLGQGRRLFDNLAAGARRARAYPRPSGRRRGHPPALSHQALRGTRGSSVTFAEIRSAETDAFTSRGQAGPATSPRSSRERYPVRVLPMALNPINGRALWRRSARPPTPTPARSQCHERTRPASPFSDDRYARIAIVKRSGQPSRRAIPLSTSPSPRPSFQTPGSLRPVTTAIKRAALMLKVSEVGAGALGEAGARRWPAGRDVTLAGGRRGATWRSGRHAWAWRPRPGSRSWRAGGCRLSAPTMGGRRRSCRRRRPGRHGGCRQVTSAHRSGPRRSGCGRRGCPRHDCLRGSTSRFSGHLIGGGGDRSPRPRTSSARPTAT